MNAVTELPLAHLDDDQFRSLCELVNPYDLERTADKTILLASPVNPLFSSVNARLVRVLSTWADDDGTGTVYDSSAGWTLPNGAIRSPDASWVRNDRWQAIPEAERVQGFPKLVPDFVAELRSPGNAMAGLHNLPDKMLEYVQNGVRLAWLIDPIDEKAYIYRQEGLVATIGFDETLLGEDVLQGFELPLHALRLRKR